MRRECGEMTRGSIIQMSIIGVAVVLAGVFVYRNFIRSDLDPERGTDWLCSNCGEHFYVTPGRFEELFEDGEVKVGPGGIHAIQCPNCKEYQAYRAYQCPKCKTWCNLTHVVNEQLVCPKCGYNIDAEEEG